jgi:hypothetical protein
MYEYKVQSVTPLHMHYTMSIMGLGCRTYGLAVLLISNVLTFAATRVLNLES